MIKQLVISAAFVVAASSCTRLPEVDYDAFGSEVEHLRSDYQNTGLALAVVRNNQVCYSEAMGDLQPSSLVRIASISKTFVGAALMQQVKAGRVSLGDDAGKLLGIPLRNPRFPDVPITLEQLLSHTSSINERYSRLDELNPDLNPEYARAYNFYPPAKGYEYCDFNITLAANILERLTGERFDNYIRDHILRPLDIDGDYNLDSLDASRLARLWYVEPDSVEEATAAYKPVDLEGYRLGADAHRFAPASGMKLSLEGLTRWMLFLMNDKTTAEMMRPRYKSYHNYGITLLHSSDYSHGVSLVGHKGGAYGMRSAFYFNPEDKYGFVVISSGALLAPESIDSSPLPEELRYMQNSYLYDGEGDSSIRVPLLRLMYATFIDPLSPLRDMLALLHERYPEATLQDVYKTCYQDFFGAEHIVSDTASARLYLYKEIEESADTDLTGIMPLEPTGYRHRFWRVNLWNVTDSLMSKEQLLSLFLAAAGTDNALDGDWQQEWRLIEKTALEVNPDWRDMELQVVLRQAAEERCAVRHSDAFRNTYHPHYRIVKL